MRWFSFITILLAATVLEAGNLLNVFAITGWYIKPGILITLLVYYALVCRYEEAIVTSFFIGFAADLANGVMGPHMICYGLFGVFLNQMGKMLVLKRAVFKAAIVFTAFVLVGTGAYWLRVLKTGEAGQDAQSLIFLQGLYSAVVSPLIWSVLSALSSWTNIQKTRADWTYH
jgi:rod shape-determining protein MreD